MEDNRIILKKRIGGGQSSDVYIIESPLYDKPVVGVRIRLEDFPDETERSHRIKRFHTQFTISHFMGAKAKDVFPETYHFFLEPTANCYWMTMEQFEGNLSDKIKDSIGLGWDNALRWLIGPLYALHLSHQDEIFHRDVKPDNILYKESKVVLADLGLVSAKGLVRHFTKTGIVHGTEEYIHPLRYSVDINNDVLRFSDLFAWYVSLFELAEGSLPELIQNRPIQSHHYRDYSFIKEILMKTPENLCQKLSPIFSPKQGIPIIHAKDIASLIIETFPSSLNDEYIKKYLSLLLI